MSDENDNDGGNNVATIDIVVSEGWVPTPQRMIIVKSLANGDVHAEDNDGQMIIIRADGTVKTFLEDDTDWVTGRIHNMSDTWEIIGFYLNMGPGNVMAKARNAKPN